MNQITTVSPVTVASKSPTHTIIITIVIIIVIVLVLGGVGSGIWYAIRKSRVKVHPAIIDKNKQEADSIASLTKALSIAEKAYGDELNRIHKLYDPAKITICIVDFIKVNIPSGKDRVTLTISDPEHKEFPLLTKFYDTSSSLATINQIMSQIRNVKSIILCPGYSHFKMVPSVNNKTINCYISKSPDLDTIADLKARVDVEQKHLSDF